MKQKRKFLAWLLLLAMVFTSIPAIPAKAEAATDKVINALEYGVDPTGETDSTVAIWNALQAAKEAEADGSSVTLEFPKGEYHIYKDKAQTRNYHTSNTNSIENPVKTIGFLIEDHENLTIDGNGSLFMMHGNMMALAVVRSRNITLKDFAWDFAVPTVVEMTVTAVGSNYTDYYIPDCFPHTVSGNTIQWSSDLSPYTGTAYWSGSGHQPDGRNTYAVVGYQPDEEMARNYYPSDGPLSNVSSITEIDGNNVRVYYSSRSGAQSQNQKEGTIFELCGNAHRETAGAFTWESENVNVEDVDVHFMHGFGWLIQMSKDVYYRRCNLVPRENSGHTTVSFADGIHASGAAGQLLFEDCNFANTHDDPLNLHGTFTLVRGQSGNTLTLRYEHGQQGGFTQYHVGDKVQFFTRSTLESTDGEKMYTVAEVIQDAATSSDERTMQIRFEETLPSGLANGYVAENVTYAPAVTIKGCTFKNVATRGVLCTTRNKVIIEDNVFLNMSMATIYLSNDSNEWYESGPIRDMTIRNNVFYIKDIGRTAWNTAPAIYVHPVTSGGLPDASNPIHKNITIDGNTFFMDLDRVVEAESVENLKFTNNKVYRMNPDVEINVSVSDTSLAAGENAALTVTKTGNTNNGSIDNLFQFTKCKNVLIEGNTYDDGLKLCAVADQATINNGLNVNDEEITVGSAGVSEPVRNIQYASTDASVATVDASGNITAVADGTAKVFAYYKWNDTIIRSNYVDVSVGGDGAGSGDDQEPVVTYELNPAFEIVRENDNHSYDADSIEITAEGDSDLWQWDNDLKNLFLYTPDVDRSNLRTSVKVDNLPVRENNKWDTASFILYNGDDDYYTIGKKSHYNGFATVKERAQSATETGESATTNNNVSSAWLGMTKVGDQITLDYSLNGETWTTVGNFTDSTFGNNYRIGFGTWGTTRKVTFSEFKVGTADQSYAELSAVDIMTAAGAATPDTPDVSEVFVKFGTDVVFEENGAETVIVAIPEEVQNIEMSYAFGEDAVTISKNGTALEGDFESTDRVLLDVADGDVIVITCGGKDYTFTMKMVPSNVTTVEKIAVAAMDFEVAPADEKAFFPGETVLKKGTIEVTVDEEAGNVEVLYGNLREPLTVEKDGNVYTADYTLVDGLNSFYIQSVAKDGITTKQYIVNIVYDAPAQPTLTLSSTKAQNLKAGAAVGTLAVAGVEDAAVYTYELCTGNQDTHNEYFKVVDGQLKLRKALTDGNTYFVRVKATNGEESLEASFAIIAERLRDDYPVGNLTAISESQYLPGTTSEGPDDYILDGQAGTWWHTNWNTTEATDVAKRWVGVSLPEVTAIDGIRYLSRGENGDVTSYRVEYRTTDDGNWIEITSGTWDRGAVWQFVGFPAVEAKQVRVVGVHTYADTGNDAHMSTAEFRVTVPVEEESANKEALEAVIAEAESLTPADYTEETWAALETVLAEAREIYAEDAIQEAVDEAVAALEEAIVALEEKEDPVDPEPDVPTTPVTTIFEDVADTDWFADEVQYVYDKGIMTGISDTLFDPNTAVTRATIVQTLYKLEGKPAVSDFTKYDSLNDTLDSIWWKNGLAWALNEGVAKGDSKNNVFNPDNEVTREDLATFIYRYAQYKGVDVELERTTDEILGDTFVNSWAKDAFAWAIESGLIKGKTINGVSDLAPQVGATRAELATIMMRFYENNNL